MQRLFSSLAIIILLITVAARSFSQNGKEQLGYVDGIVSKMNLRTEYDPSELAWSLADTFDNDSLRVRAFYYWISENIAYDYPAFVYKTSLTFDPDEDMDIDAYHYRRIVKTLKTKKGVCFDYALLFQSLCKSMQIKCEIVHGYALTTKPTDLLKLMLPEDVENHAWNAVFFNNKWHLLDLTFASGYILYPEGKFVRSRNESYYMADPEKFIVDHHPVMSNWQLLDSPLNIKEFIENAKYVRETGSNN